MLEKITPYDKCLPPQDHKDKALIKDPVNRLCRAFPPVFTSFAKSNLTSSSGHIIFR